MTKVCRMENNSSMYHVTECRARGKPLYTFDRISEHLSILLHLQVIMVANTLLKPIYNAVNGI